jgi:type VI secretion system protein ImpB
MPESYQHKLDRVRPPRVQITYDVETAGAIVTTELPFVVGIMADLGTSDVKLSAEMRYDTASQNGGSAPAKLAEAKTANPLPAYKERKYVNIDRDNFDEIMKSIGPRLAFDVTSQTFEQYEDKKEKDEKKKVKFRSKDAEKDASGSVPEQKIELEFNNIKDFDPISIVKQVKLLHDLFEKRSLLSDLLTKLEGNDELEKQLQDILKKDAATLKALAAPPVTEGASDGKTEGGK